VGEENLSRKLSPTRGVNAGCSANGLDAAGDSESWDSAGDQTKGGGMKFLVGYNGSDVAKAALSLARTYADLFGAEVLVVTSMVGGSSEKPEEIGKASQDLDYAQKFFQEKNIPCKAFQLARGLSPGEDLVIFAEENNVDQIFVGIEKKSKTQKIILGSNAQYIILKAPCPVVSVNSL
jgi:nucleotide-binding universal stress UspA family protein